jgi:nucleoside-diphosphate-sugar epimerase
MTIDHLFIFGIGYVAQEVIDQLRRDHPGITISGTTTTRSKLDYFQEIGIHAIEFAAPDHVPDLSDPLQDATHILHSIPPMTAGGDPVYHHYSKELKKLEHLNWFGYLSTTGVYGDHNGGLVDEATPTAPQTERSKRRVHAEEQWLNLHKHVGLPTHIFRLSGIYGPSRSVIDRLRDGRARRIAMDNQYFNRIHVADIARILIRSMQHPTPGEIYNVSDDEPAPQPDPVTYAAKKLGTVPPPLQSLEQAKLSPMAKSFYTSSKRVKNDKVKRALNIELRYPTYREGIDALIDGHK